MCTPYQELKFSILNLLNLQSFLVKKEYIIKSLTFEKICKLYKLLVLTKAPKYLAYFLHDSTM